MKAFLTALTVFFLITGFVVFCALSLTSGCDMLVSAAESLPEKVGTGREFENAYLKISRDWYELRGPVRYFVGHTDADAVEDALADMKSRNDTNDQAGYSSARQKLISSLIRIRATESFTADSLF